MESAHIIRELFALDFNFTFKTHFHSITKDNCFLGGLTLSSHLVFEIMCAHYTEEDFIGILPVTNIAKSIK